jgi:bifunctional non-homologous end joining protein LigD
MVRLAEHIPERGEDFLAAVVAQGLEGLVGKRLGSRYRAGTRTRDWVKLKQDPEADFAVCGFTAPKGSRAGLGALHLCVRDGGEWRYAGKVGSGLDDKTLVGLRKELDAAPRWSLPFPRPEASHDATWIEPALTVSVRFREWPVDSTLRFPVFMRLRRDKPAAECGMPPRHTGERPVRQDDAPIAESTVVQDERKRNLHLSNLKKIFWPGEKLTKGDLIDYYRAVSPWILPYLADRPVVITRYPDGIDGKWFYQKDLPDWVPPWLRTVTLWSEHSQREIHYTLVDDADGLAYLANLGSIPIHVWASRTVDLGRPDWTIIDLDPKGAPREHVVPLALAIHELCESIGLPNYVKTSGQTGLHVLIPLNNLCTFDQARNLAYLLGMVIERRFPDMATTLRNPAARKGRVYLDWGQNAHGQLLVAPLSVRPVPHAPVSMPLEWHEVVPALDPTVFNIRTALARLEKMPHDPVRPVLTERPDLLTALGKLQALLPDGQRGPV